MAIKFLSTVAVDTNVLYVDAAANKVGIGTTSPSEKLEVNGTFKATGDALINDLTVGKGAGTSSLGNTVFGKTALNNITSGLRNVAIGNEALLDNTTGSYNVAIGYQSLENNLANNNVAIGVQALERVETAGNNTAVGYLTLGLTLGANNTAIGYGAGYLRVGGTNGNSIGSVFIGSLTKSNGLNSENEIVIGTGAESAGSNTVVLGNDLITSTRLKGDVIVANGNVGIGTTSPSSTLHVADTGNAEILTQRSSGAGVLIQSQASVGVFGTNTNHRVDLKTNGNTRFTIDTAGNAGIGVTTPRAKLDVAGGVKVADDTDTAGANKVGTLRYRYVPGSPKNYSYVDMCMQTGASSYAWVNIVQNVWN